MFLKINKSRKADRTFRSTHPEMWQPGLICFFKNKNAKIADCVMFGAVIGVAVTGIFFNNLYVLHIFLALFVFSFGMHCMLNGKNYIYLNYQVRREEKA